MTGRERVAAAATKIIKSNPSGIRYTQLKKAVCKALPKEKPNSVTGALRHYGLNLPPGIHRPARGLYAVQDPGGADVSVSLGGKEGIKEKDFYETFAEWLTSEVQEATSAIPIGGNVLGGKWGTPDVIGMFSPSETDAVKFTREVLAAEIKIDTQALIVAFGQACAYKLFAHRVYMVVPQNSDEQDLQRLDALASVVGIGLVKFNAMDTAYPDFQVMVRAAKHEPDYFYTNEALRKLSHQQRKGLGL
ncbi:hypothetical protein [Lysobacter sp. HA35]